MFEFTSLDYAIIYKVALWHVLIYPTAQLNLDSDWLVLKINIIITYIIVIITANVSGMEGDSSVSSLYVTVRAKAGIFSPQRNLMLSMTRFDLF